MATYDLPDPRGLLLSQAEKDKLGDLMHTYHKNNPNDPAVASYVPGHEKSLESHVENRNQAAPTDDERSESH